MKIEVFKEIVLKIQEQDVIIDKAYAAGIDLMNLFDPIQQVSSHLIGSIYGSSGKETFEWWCFENDYGTKGLTMTDKEGNLLCQTVEDLHSYLEDNKVDDYKLPKKYTDEERLQTLKGMFG